MVVAAAPAVVAVPAPVVAAAPAPSTNATVVVQLPADARMYVDNQPTNLTSARRTFTTPPLQPGREYYYTVRAEALRDGQTVTENKRVIVRAGQVARVSFDELTATPVARAAEPEAATARITVRLPADARLFVNGQAVSLTSATRSFETPKLQPGREYSYTLKAEVVRDGQTRTASRDVVFQAGKQVTVDFSNMTAVSVASR